jgi:hypothetical protein
MSSIGPKHKQLDETGTGLCSVPMWMGGAPAGFCDKPAYGIPPKSGRFMNYAIGEMQRIDNRYDGYVPALACIGHGGPRSRVFKDGNAFCAVFPDFINLQESESGWGDSPEAARSDLRIRSGKETR